MNKLVRRQLEGAAVTSLFITMILLFSFMLNSAILFSQGVSSAYEEGYFENTKKPHELESKRVQTYHDPFRFPMPLGKPDMDKSSSIDERTHQNSRHSDGLASSSDTLKKYSTYKETMISDKKTTKKTSNNLTKVPYTNAKSANLSNVPSIHQRSWSAVAADTDKTTQTYFLHTNGKDIPVRYKISGFSNELLNMTTQPHDTTLSIYMSTSSPGTFMIELPRNITDFINQDPHNALGVFEDRHYTSFHQTENNSYTRKLTIPFNKGTSQIAIAGTHTSPEYGLTTILYGISMCIAMVVLTLVTRQNSFNSRSLNKR